jgi:hypothetical protein
MVFTKENGLVKVWVSLVRQGTFTLDEVPALYNLRDVVTETVSA